MPASACAWRSPAASTIAPPCENPVSTIRSLVTPRSCSRAMSASTSPIDARTPASSWRAMRSNAAMSYQARIGTPLLTVTGRTGACGNTKRSGGQSGSTSSGTIGAKSLPSAPSPCSQMMLWVGLGPVSCSTVGRPIASSQIQTGKAVANLPHRHSRLTSFAVVKRLAGMTLGYRCDEDTIIQSPSRAGVVDALGMALEVLGPEVDRAQVAGGIAVDLVGEVRRSGMATLAARLDGARMHPWAEFDRGDETVAAVAVKALGARPAVRAKGGQGAPKRRRERHRDAGLAVVEVRRQRIVQALEAVDFAPGHAPTAEILLQSLDRGGQRVEPGLAAGFRGHRVIARQ